MAVPKPRAMENSIAGQVNDKPANRCAMVILSRSLSLRHDIRGACQVRRGPPDSDRDDAEKYSALAGCALQVNGGRDQQTERQRVGWAPTEILHD